MLTKFGNTEQAANGSGLSQVEKFSYFDRLQ